MAESVEQLLRSLTSASGENASQIYATWAGLTIPSFGASGGDDTSLFGLVCQKLTANAKSAQIRKSLLATLLAGGAVGESVEGCLLHSSLTGWS